ncbi:radical SAM protein, partial [bacterium]|nr:radical SAM protein [candidate division CSSED10-310 bacterium]
ALHLFPIDRYHSSAQLRGDRTLHLFTSRGCPYHCAYCSGDLIFGRSFRYSSAGRVITEIKRLRDEFGVDSVQFYDETFTVNRRRVMELCRRMIDERLGMEWACFTRVDAVDEELLRTMHRAGCYQIFFGVETGVPRLLAMIQKETTLAQARVAFRLCRRIGIETVASFMLTLPTETEAETWQSIRFGLELDPDYVYWLTFTPYPGTKLTRIARESGTITSTDYASYNVFNRIVYIPEGRDEAEIKRTLAKAYKKFYFRPRSIIRRLSSFRRLPPAKIAGLLRGGFNTFLRKRM